VTISTAGHADGIARLGRLALKNLRLAISINAADDALRTGLMPINYRFPLQRLKKELRAYPLGKRGVLFLEYVLLAGVNDSKEHARQLSRFVKDLPARINLIPYNPSAALPHQALPPEKVEQFRAWLVEENLFVRVRRSHGEGIMAACGQLCGKTAKKN
jgi:23S rRNA (adenine2503-C2)-methyltransferase